MLVIKKINNNVAICQDSNKKELIAFGKGIGFPQMPYEITDMSKIDRTFYNINSQYIAMINDLPADVLEFTSTALDVFRQELDYELNPNTVFTLADHIAFAIQREKKGIYIKMPLSYDMEQMYPKEIEIAGKILAQLNKTFHTHLTKNEISGIAMNFINNQLVEEKDEHVTIEESVDFDHILEQVTMMIEQDTGILVNRNSFSYARFATHLHYLMERLGGAGQIDTENQALYQDMQERCPAVGSCVDRIGEYLDCTLGCELSQEEKLYLILHVNRVCEKEGL